MGSGYTLIVEQPGFATAKMPNLSVGVNQRTTADVTLQLGSTTQTVDVTSEATETIDLVTTTIGANIDESLYKNIPVGRNISSIIAMAPGAADGLGTGAANPSINGASGLENEYVINGANVTDPGFGGFGTYSRNYGSLGNGVNFDFIQEVQVKTGGFEAAYGQALGGVINILTKSGGNTYHGSFYSYFAPKALAVDARNANPLLVNQGTYVSGDSKYDFGGDLGGNSKLGTISVDTRTLNYQGKVNYNISPNHSIEGSVFGDPSTVPKGYVSYLSLASSDNLSTSSLDYGSRTWTGRYNGVLSPKWVVSVNYSNYYNKFLETPAFNGYQVQDITPTQEPGNTNPVQTYGGLGFVEGTESKVNEASASSSHLFNFMGGHTLEYGYQFEDVVYDDTRKYSGPDFKNPDLPEFGIAAGQTVYGAQVQRTHANGDPTQPIVIEVVRGNYSSPVVATQTRYHAGYIQDSWTLGRRITIKPGLRFEQQAETGNAFRYVFSHNWAPRIGVIVDPTGNRKSKFFANWGRFYEKIPLDIAVRSFSFETSADNGYYKDPGPGQPVDLSPSNYIPVAQGGNAPVLLGSPLFAENVYAGTRAQYQDEVVAGFEHEFKNGMTFNSRFVYRHLRRVLEDTSGINVTQALAGVTLNYVVSNPSATSDDFHNPVVCTSGPDCVGGYTADSGALGPDGKADGFPNPTRIYKAAEFIMSKRFSHGFQFYASYRLAKLVGNYEGNFRNDNAQSDPNISSMFDFTNTDGLLADQFKVGLLPTDRTNQVKLFGNYEWKGFNFGSTWIVQSGTPLSAFLAHPAYTNAGEIPTGGRGTKGRTPATFPLDFHADYTVKLSEQKRLKFGADMFNLFNQKRALYLDQNLEVAPGSPDADYKKPFGIFLGNQPNAYQSPFIARLSARFEF